MCIVVGTFVPVSGNTTCQRESNRRKGRAQRTLQMRSIDPSSSASCEPSSGSMNSSTKTFGICRPRSIGSNGEAMESSRCSEIGPHYDLVVSLADSLRDGSKPA